MIDSVSPTSINPSGACGSLIRTSSKETAMPTLLLLSMAILLSGLTARPTMAQDTKVVKLGLLGLTEGECGNQSLREGLRELGYVEGENLVVECRHGGGRYEGLQLAADEVARAKPDVIVALTHLTADAAHAATQSIPVVFIASSDPVAGGFAASLPRPGGNMTGLTYYAGELNAKRLELLKAVAPGIRRVGVLASPYMARSVNEVYIRDIRAAAETLQLDVQVFVTPEGDDLEPTFAEMTDWKADALYILPTIIFAYQAQQIADLAKWHRLPTIHWYKPFAALGGLMAYGVDYPALQKRAARYVDKILKGAKPADLPIEQPTQYELLINRETADDLGLSIPQSIALRADRIVE
jgi:putative tryptophan/tyrosine transport system substrate-binding protein